MSVIVLFTESEVVSEMGTVHEIMNNKKKATIILAIFMSVSFRTFERFEINQSGCVTKKNIQIFTIVYKNKMN